MTDELILTRYTDALGAERSSPDWAVEHVRALLDEPRGVGGFTDVVRAQPGWEVPALVGRTITVDPDAGGGELRVEGRIPDDLPIGYHRTEGDQGPVLILTAPWHVPSPTTDRGWVLAAQLYSARSGDSWGHGDLRDARRLAAWVRDAGPGGHLMVNPLHAPLPGAHPQPSPYFASTRSYRNPLYLCVDELGGDQVALDRWRREAVALNDERQLDRHRAWAAKDTALRRLWLVAAADAETAARVDAWLADPVNVAYARFCAATAANDGRPPAASAATLADEPITEEHRYWAWLQLLLEEQLLAVGPGMVHDVAVGTDRAGADAWLWPDAYVLDGTRIGCPPDQFNTLGQDWGLPPLHPVGLRAAGYEPLIRAVRSALVGAAGIRIDHVMGLERLFWIPEAGSPPDGVYVRYELEEQLDVVAIEAFRAQAFVVGEDLGTVPPSIPEALANRHMLSYKIMSLDPTEPAWFPHAAMAAVTTHDLATSVGLLTGSDLADQRTLDLAPNEADTTEAVARLHRWTGVGEDRPLEELVEAVHRLLAASPAQLVAGTLEDLAAMVERPNMPGTIDEWPNWRWGLPAPLEEVLGSELALRLRAALAERSGAPS